MKGLDYPCLYLTYEELKLSIDKVTNRLVTIVYILPMRN
ncbi:hypothetical protein B4065_3819 [Caldibacillus thermoamylovorans]|nr:hypothetical protein B4065_3819 [Caldibacillus thermoamylovorans]